MRSYRDKAEQMYEQSMEVVHGKVGQAKECAIELEGIIDQIVREEDREKADVLIEKMIRALEDIC